MANNSGSGVKGQQNGKSTGQEEVLDSYDETIIHKVSRLDEVKKRLYTIPPELYEKTCLRGFRQGKT